MHASVAWSGSKMGEHSGRLMDDLIFLLADERSPRFPRSVVEKSISSTSATIQWRLTDPYNPSQPETFYVSYGFTSGQLNMITPGVTADSTRQTYSTQLNSLRPAMVYIYRLVAMNRFDTLFYNELAFVTEDDSELISPTIPVYLETHSRPWPCMQ